MFHKCKTSIIDWSPPTITNYTAECSRYSLFSPRAQILASKRFQNRRLPENLIWQLKLAQSGLFPITVTTNTTGKWSPFQVFSFVQNAKIFRPRAEWTKDVKGRGCSPTCVECGALFCVEKQKVAKWSKSKWALGKVKRYSRPTKGDQKFFPN